MKFALFVVCVWSFLGGAALAASAPYPHPDARVLRTGRFDYRTVSAGKTVGEGTVTVQRSPDSRSWIFASDVTFLSSFAGFQTQHWRAFADVSMTPSEAELRFGAADSVPVFALRYAAGRVTGYAIGRHGPEKGVRRAIDGRVPPDIVDQRVDWAAVMASDLEPGRRFGFEVYDPSTTVSPVSVNVLGEERIRTSAGSFETIHVDYGITKNGKVEHYRIWVTNTRPRCMVREIFPDGSVSDLVKAS